jgi:hypothetical protein
MATPVWKAYIVNITPDNYVIINEKDKKFITLPLPITYGSIHINEEYHLDIQDITFDPKKLFMACKEYDYNLRRKKAQYIKKKQKYNTIKHNDINPFY